MTSRLATNSTNALVALAAAVVLAGCSNSKDDVRVEGILIAQATATMEAPEAPTVTLVPRQRADEVALPDGNQVRVAIDREVSYGAAKALLDRVKAAGKEPIILVGERHRLKAYKLNDEIENPRRAIRLVATPDGKACVAPPDNPESKCAEQVYSNHVSVASVREFVRDAIKTYKLSEVRVFARPSVQWADVLRAVDGARTCCDGKFTPRVKLVDVNEDGSPAASDEGTAAPN